MDFEGYWDEKYTDCDPIPYLLRDFYSDRWVRFHSLPQSKRYAESDSEYQIILERHNAVLSEIATPDERLVFVSAGYSESAEPVRSYPELIRLDPTAAHWKTIAKHDPDEDAEFHNFWHLHTSIWSWTPGTFDPILRLVADNVVANTMIISMANHWIYHPYDGGCDVILRTPDLRTQLKQIFKSWLSRRRDGL